MRKRKTHTEPDAVMQSQGASSPPKLPEITSNGDRGTVLCQVWTYDSVISLLPGPGVRSCALIGCLTQSQVWSLPPTDVDPVASQARSAMHPCCCLQRTPPPPVGRLGPSSAYECPLLSISAPSPLPRGPRPPRRGDVARVGFA